MSTLSKFWADRHAAAAAEMALVTPMLLIIMFGTFEVGNYFRSEHILAKGVRDGARYAARAPFPSFAGCTTSPQDVPSTLYDNTKLIVRKGVLDSGANDLLPDWGPVGNSCTGNPAGGCFEVKMTCVASAGGTALSGIYKPTGTGSAVAPVVTVTAQLPYHPVLGAMGWSGRGYPIQAQEQAAATGI